MNIRKIMISTLISGLVFFTQLSFANVPNTTVHLATVITKLQVAGYDQIYEVEFDDNTYKAEVSKDNKEVDLTINPTNYEITIVKTQTDTKPAMTPPLISFLEAIKNVEEGQYHNVYKIEFKGPHYEVEALDQKDKKVKLIVNAETGMVSLSND